MPEIKFEPRYEHRDGGPVCIGLAILSVHVFRDLVAVVPLAEIPSLIRQAEAALAFAAPKKQPEAIGTPIPTDAEVAATTKVKPTPKKWGGWLWRDA